MIKSIKIIFLLIFLFSNNLKAQEILWADKVITYSSKLIWLDDDANTSNSPEQALGKPNIHFSVYDNPGFWVVDKIHNLNENIKRTGTDEEYIKLGFEKLSDVNTILINMNRYSGLLKSISLYNDKNKKILVYQKIIDTKKIKGNFLTIHLAEVFKNTNTIELRFQKTSDIGIAVDAVGVTFLKEKKDIKLSSFINLFPDFEEIKKDNLGKKINTSSQEIAPHISLDGKMLYFIRANYKHNIGDTTKQDIWYSQFDEKNNEWQEAKNIGEPINNKFHNSMFNVFDGGNKILLNNIYEKDILSNIWLKKGLSFSEKKGNMWQFPEQIKINGFYNLSDYSEYFMSDDQNILLMTVQNQGGFGGKDIHISFKQGNTYSKPINLGKIINTASNETSPFLSKDKKTLFFATDGHLGYGNYDIFVSYRLDDTWRNWSEPINLGKGINSGQWDAYFSITEDGNLGYLCSYDNSIGESDIFKIQLSEKQKKILFNQK